MKYLFFSVVCLILAVSCKFKRGNILSFSKPATIRDSVFQPADVLMDSGWTSLVWGNLQAAWHTYGKKDPGKAWELDSTSIHIRPGVKYGYQTAGGGDLVSNDTFGNFDLKLEWKIGKKANSGILIFVQEDKLKYPETWNTGPEMQVCDKDSNEDAHSYKHEAGDLYDLIASRTMAAKPALEWNQVEIVSNNGRLDLYLNDTHIISSNLWDESWRKLIAASKFSTMADFGSFRSGRIALQDHGEEVWFRNIRVKKI